MLSHPTDLFPYRPISFIWMIIFVSSSFSFFVIINRTITSGQKHVKNVQSNWLRQNTLLSFVHALICSGFIGISVCRTPEMFKDPLSHSNYFNYALIAFSLGYFLYDLQDFMRNSTTSRFAILIHHILVSAFLFHVLLYTRNLGYAIYGLSIEINSVFLHARRLVRWYSSTYPSVYCPNLLQIIIDAGNYITFVLFRFGIVLVGLRALYIQRSRLHPIGHVFTVMIVLAMGILNVVLFYRLVRNQLGGKGKQTDEETRLTNDQILLPG